MRPLLLLNAGSSSLKGTLVASFEGPVLAQGSADWAGEYTEYHYSIPGEIEHRERVEWSGHAATVRRFLNDLQHRTPILLEDPASLCAVGHRIVHGGDFRQAVRLTDDIQHRIAALVELAPLHNPPSLNAAAAARELLPEVPHIATFDTAFHSTLSPAASIYPIPSHWTQVWGIRRYGFHGLSYAYCTQRAAEMSGRPVAELRLIICHLGHGCSAAAILGGRSVDTTMGFTPLDGLMMGTRSGSIDPAIGLYVQQQHGLTAAEVETILNRQSGLLGVSGISADMREILAAAKSGHEQARLALEIYVHRLRQTIGAYVATLGGLDALVFTAGVGEHAAEIRQAVTEGLQHLGLELDQTANTGCQPDADIATTTSRTRILVITTREDVAMLREIQSVLADNS